MLYTGGTTGMPKGVMWRQDDLFMALDARSRVPLPESVDWDAFDARVAKPGPRALASAPLMHGTAVLNSFNVLANGGSVATLTAKSLDIVEMLDTIERERVSTTAIVGDAFAKPLLRALDAEPDRWDISSLRVIISSGVMWSKETKQGLLRHNARLMLIDTLGSSEAVGMATQVTDASNDGATAQFSPAKHTKVIDDDGNEVLPGSGIRGRVAIRGRVPVGYYKDASKSAATFLTINGSRYSIPGDYAEVDADGSIRLLGRGSVCINTGGEKVFPEEVEEVLKQHRSVADAVVVGLPDERFGEAITAIVELGDSASFDEAKLIAHVKEHLAAYKSPKRVLSIDSIGRAANGKVDYQRLKQLAIDMIGAVPTQ